MPDIEDRRPRISDAAWRSPALTPKEKLVLLRMVDLDAEHDARGFSRAMDALGKVRLRHEHIADSLSLSRTAVAEAIKGLRAKGHLDIVRRGTHGRPTEYQALVNRTPSRAPRGGEIHPLGEGESQSPRGGENRHHNGREIPPLGEPARGGKNTPPICKTPDQGNHPPRPREEPMTVPTGKDAARKSNAEGSFSSPRPCPHGVPNGNLPDPWLDGDLCCPQCRAKAKESA